MRISTGSLHARPKNETPAGRPETNPMGTLMSGYPAMAAGPALLPPSSRSPLMWSVTQGRSRVGATTASSRC